MRPGITVQHAELPHRRLGLVRCDITALVAAIPRERWPEGASQGDLLEARFHRSWDWWESPLRHLLSGAAVRAAATFFENGGEVLHVFGVCVETPRHLASPSTEEGPLAELFHRLRTEDDLGLLIAPDAALLPATVARSGEVHAEAELLWNHLLTHAREMGNRFVLVDAPRGVHGDDLLRWADDFTRQAPESRSFGALYYPWLQRAEEVFPPSGAIAGVYARTEREHEPFGVLWPPANVPVRGATHVQVDLDWREVGDLAERQVNPLVVQLGRGVVIWGARTLSRDPAFAHINSRRVVSMVTEQLRRDCEWAVFEQNDSNTWKVVERDASVRLEEFWRAGLISGDLRQGDYEVVCDSTTNPPATRESGTLNVQVRIRPIGTTEHITIDLRLGANAP